MNITDKNLIEFYGVDREARQLRKRRVAGAEIIQMYLRPYKAMLMQMCHEDGLTQAEVLTALIKSEAQKRCM